MLAACTNIIIIIIIMGVNESFQLRRPHFQAGNREPLLSQYSTEGSTDIVVQCCGNLRCLTPKLLAEGS